MHAYGFLNVWPLLHMPFYWSQYILLCRIFFLDPSGTGYTPVVCVWIRWCFIPFASIFAHSHGHNFHVWIPFRFNVDSYCITSFSTTKMRSTADTCTSSFFPAKCFYSRAHLFFTHLFYVHPFKMLMHEFTLSIAFAPQRIRTHTCAKDYVNVCFFVDLHSHFLFCDVCVFACVCRTFVKLTFIRHKIHHFTKVNALSHKKSKWCKW